MGGAGAHEFMAPSQAGEDEVALCEKCGYAANVELADSSPAPPSFPSWKLEEVATPDSRTIEEVSRFLGIDPRLTIKSLLLMGNDGPVLALVRGDQQLHEKKFRRLMGDFRPAHREEVKEYIGAEAGFVGPVAIPSGKEIPDHRRRVPAEGGFCRGGQQGWVSPPGCRAGRTFQRSSMPTFISPPAGMPVRGARQALQVEKTIEIGNIFKLGTKYSQPHESLLFGPERRREADRHGELWHRTGAHHRRRGRAELRSERNDPPSVSDALSMFTCCRSIPSRKPSGRRPTVSTRALQDAQIETLYDDREEAPGVKFKDADLIGLPLAPHAERQNPERKLRGSQNPPERPDPYGQTGPDRILG